MSAERHHSYQAASLADTAEHPLASETLIMESQEVGRTRWQIVKQMAAVLYRRYQEAGLPQGLTLEMEQNVLDQYAADTAQIRNMPHFSLGDRINMADSLMKILQNAHPELANEPSIRLHFLQKTGHIPYLA